MHTDLSLQFEEFPQYKPDDERISLFTESFGGHYGPGFMDYFIRQNDKITRGEIPRDGAHYMHLSTLGIVNGCIDAPDMFESEIIFAYNNTYGIQAISQDDYEWSMNEFHKPGGVLDDLQKCREAELQTDPHNHGTVAATNKICSEAGERAENISDGMYEEGGRRAPFDITHDAQDSFPPSFVLGWLNQVEVQQALGVPVNHSWFSQAVSKGFSSTGDIAKGGQLEQLRNVLEHGITVALLYGDRDFACNVSFFLFLFFSRIRPPFPPLLLYLPTTGIDIVSDHMYMKLKLISLSLPLSSTTVDRRRKIQSQRALVRSSQIPRSRIYTTCALRTIYPIRRSRSSIWEFVIYTSTYLFSLFLSLQLPIHHTSFPP